MKRFLLVLSLILIGAITASALDPIRVSVVTGVTTTATAIQISIINPTSSTGALTIDIPAQKTDASGVLSFVIPADIAVEGSSLTWGDLLLSTYKDWIVQVRYPTALIATAKLEFFIKTQGLFGAVVEPDEMDETGDYRFGSVTLGPDGATIKLPTTTGGIEAMEFVLKDKDATATTPSLPETITLKAPADIDEEDSYALTFPLIQAAENQVLQTVDGTGTFGWVTNDLQNAYDNGNTITIDGNLPVQIRTDEPKGGLDVFAGTGSENAIDANIVNNAGTSTDQAAVIGALQAGPDDDDSDYFGVLGGRVAAIDMKAGVAGFTGTYGEDMVYGGLGAYVGTKNYAGYFKGNVNVTGEIGDGTNWYINRSGGAGKAVFQDLSIMRAAGTADFAGTLQDLTSGTHLWSILNTGAATFSSLTIGTIGLNAVGTSATTSGASLIGYDHSTSALSASNVQTAIDELDGMIDAFDLQHAYVHGNGIVVTAAEGTVALSNTEGTTTLFSLNANAVGSTAMQVIRGIAQFDDAVILGNALTDAIYINGTISNPTGTTDPVTIDDALTQLGSGNQVTFAGNVNATNGLDVTGANLTVGPKFAVDVATGNLVFEGLTTDGTNKTSINVNDPSAPRSINFPNSDGTVMITSQVWQDNTTDVARFLPVWNEVSQSFIQSNMKVSGTYPNLFGIVDKGLLGAKVDGSGNISYTSRVELGVIEGVGTTSPTRAATGYIKINGKGADYNTAGGIAGMNATSSDSKGSIWVADASITGTSPYYLERYRGIMGFDAVSGWINMIGNYAGTDQVKMYWKSGTDYGFNVGNTFTVDQAGNVNAKGATTLDGNVTLGDNETSDNITIKGTITDGAGSIGANKDIFISKATANAPEWISVASLLEDLTAGHGIQYIDVVGTTYDGSVARTIRVDESAAYAWTGAHTLGNGDDEIIVNANDWTVDASGNATFAGTLQEKTLTTPRWTITNAGAATFKGLVKADLGLDVNGANLTVGGAGTFLVTPAGIITQTVNQQVIFGGNVNATNGLDVTTAPLTVVGTAGVSPIDFQLTGDATITGTLSENAVPASGDWSITPAGIATFASQVITPLIGTITNADLVFQRNSVVAGRIGETNTSFGLASLESATPGADNVAMGYWAVRNNTGSNNTGVGTMAIAQQTTGSNNTAIGYNAGNQYTGGLQNTIANQSVYLGSNTKALASGGTNEIVIGYNATGHGSNTATLGTTAITNTYLNGVITINGTLAQNGTIKADGVNSTPLATPYETGAIVIDDELTVNGASSLNGNVNLGDDADDPSQLGVTDDLVTVKADFKITNTISAGTDVFTIEGANGNTIIGGTLDVTGVTNFNNTTTSTSAISGAVIVDGGVGIAENLWVGGTLDVAKKVDLAATGLMTTVRGTLNVKEVSDFDADVQINGAQLEIYNGTGNLMVEAGKGTFNEGFLTTQNAGGTELVVLGSTSGLQGAVTVHDADGIHGAIAFDGTNWVAGVQSVSLKAGASVNEGGTLAELSIDNGGSYKPFSADQAGVVYGSTYHTRDLDNQNGVEIGNSNSLDAGYIDINGSLNNPTVVLGQGDGSGLKGTVSVRDGSGTTSVIRGALGFDGTNWVAGVQGSNLKAGASVNEGGTLAELSIDNGGSYKPFSADQDGVVYGSTFHTRDLDNTNGVEIGNSNSLDAGYIDINSKNHKPTIILGQGDGTGVKGTVTVLDDGVIRGALGYDGTQWVSGVKGTDGYSAGALSNGTNTAMLAVTNSAGTPVFTANELGNVTAAGTLDVEGQVDLAVAGLATNVHGTLLVDQTAGFRGDVNVSDGTYTFDNPSAGVDLYVEGNLEVDGTIYGKLAGVLSETALGGIKDFSYDGSTSVTIEVDKTQAFVWTGNHTFGSVGTPVQVEVYSTNWSVNAEGVVKGSTFHTSDLDNTNGVEIGNSNSLDAGYIDINSKNHKPTIILGQGDGTGVKGTVTVLDDGVIHGALGYDGTQWVAGVQGSTNYSAGALSNGTTSAMLAVNGGSATPAFSADQDGDVIAKGTLEVYDLATFHGNVDANYGLDVTGGAFNMWDASVTPFNVFSINYTNGYISNPSGTNPVTVNDDLTVTGTSLLLTNIGAVAITHTGASAATDLTISSTFGDVVIENVAFENGFVKIGSAASTHSLADGFADLFVGRNLEVDGTAWFDGAVTIGDDADLVSVASTNWDVTTTGYANFIRFSVGTGTPTTALADGGAYITGNLEVDGSITDDGLVGGGLVTVDDQLEVNGNLDAKAGLDVTGALTVSTTSTLTGDITLNGAAAQSITQTGTGDLTISSTNANVVVDGVTFNAGALSTSVSIATTGTGTLTVAGVTTLSNLSTANGIVTTNGSGVLSSSTALPDGTTATTQTAGDNTTKVATDAFVTGAISTLSGSKFLTYAADANLSAEEVLTAGNGITLTDGTGTMTIAAKLDGTTLANGTAGLKVNTSGITANEIATSAVGTDEILNATILPEDLSAQTTTPWVFAANVDATNGLDVTGNSTFSGTLSDVGTPDWSITNAGLATFVDLNLTGSATITANVLRLKDDVPGVDATLETVTLQAPNDIADGASYTLTYPAAAPATPGSILMTAVDGTLSWLDILDAVNTWTLTNNFTGAVNLGDGVEHIVVVSPNWSVTNAGVANFASTITGGSTLTLGNDASTMGKISLNDQASGTALGTLQTATTLGGNRTWTFPDANGTVALLENKLSDFAVTTSAELNTYMLDETGTGALVFGTNPVLVAPNLGTPTTLVGTNITGTAAGLTAGNVTTNANLTGMVTSVGNTTTVVTNANLTGPITSVGNATSVASQTGTGSTFVMNTSPTLVTPILGIPTSVTLTNATGLPLTTGVTGVLPATNGGTGLSAYTTGSILYANGVNSLTTLAAGTNGNVLTLSGGVPVWSAVVDNSISNELITAVSWTDATDVLTITEAGVPFTATITGFEPTITTKGNVSTTTTGVTIGGSPTGAVIGAGVTINIGTADGTNPGLLSAANWNTFNGKENALTFSTGLTRTTNTITVNTTQNITNLSNLSTNGIVTTTSSNGTLGVVATLPIANGGTNSSTALSGSSIMVSNGSAIVQGAAGTNVQVLHGNAGGAPTYGAVVGGDLDPAISISTTGSITTTGTGALTVAGNTTLSGKLVMSIATISNRDNLDESNATIINYTDSDGTDNTLVTGGGNGQLRACTIDGEVMYVVNSTTSGAISVCGRNVPIGQTITLISVGGIWRPII